MISSGAKKIHAPDYWLIGILAAILVFGLVMLSSASTAVAWQRFQDNFYYLKHQLLNGVLPGLLVFYVASRIDYRVWRKLALPLLLLGIALLIAVFIPGLGFSYGGAARWVKVGFFIFQPSEVIKILLIIYLAAWLEKKGSEGVGSIGFGFIPFLVILTSILSLVVLQPDIGTMSIIALTAVTVFWVGGGGFKQLLCLLLLGAFMLGFLVKVAPYRIARLTVFLNPQVDPQGIGYHVNQALLAVGSGGLFGQGLGLSRQKHLYLPEVIGDSIFAIIAEELGFVFSTVLIFLFCAFVFRMFRVASLAPDPFGKLLAVGVSAWIGFQAIINIGAMIGILPLTGLPLPLISYGSSAMVSLLFSVGILVNISRHTAKTAR